MSAPIKVDSWVRTADGAKGRVRFVGPRYDASKGGYSAEHYADVVIDNEGESIALPVAELRRIADPMKKRPVIKGMPSERPTCPMCGKRLLPLVDATHDQTRGKGAYGKVVGRTFRGWLTRGGVFHSTTCAVQFARLAHKAGYRITKGK